jgi:hypothetical protein
MHLFSFMEIAVTRADEDSPLLARYTIALRKWSLVRFHHPSDSPEVIEANRILNALESELHSLRGTAIVKHQPPQ